MNLLVKVFSFFVPKLLTVLEDIGDAIESVGAWIVSLFTSIVPIFYDATGGSLTFIGWLTVVGFGLGLVMMVLRIIRSYVRL